MDLKLSNLDSAVASLRDETAGPEAIDRAVTAVRGAVRHRTPPMPRWWTKALATVCVAGGLALLAYLPGARSGQAWGQVVDASQSVHTMHVVSYWFDDNGLKHKFEEDWYDSRKHSTWTVGAGGNIFRARWNGDQYYFEQYGLGRYGKSTANVYHPIAETASLESWLTEFKVQGVSMELQETKELVPAGAQTWTTYRFGAKGPNPDKVNVYYVNPTTHLIGRIERSENGRPRTLTEMDYPKAIPSETFTIPPKSKIPVYNADLGRANVVKP